MAEKTLAEIARAAWMNAGNLEDHWEITAAAVRNAVIEECAKIADEYQVIWSSGECITAEKLIRAKSSDEIAAALRALKEDSHG